jgi:excisionase family DNA binding protein
VDKLFTPHEVCAQLQISRKTLQRLCDSRAIGFLRVGIQLRFRESAVAFYISKAERLPVPQRKMAA